MKVCGFNIQINNILYYVRCDGSFERNINRNSQNQFGLNLFFTVKNVTRNYLLSGEEIKGSYLAEKIADFVRNTINGYRGIYWCGDASNENGDIIFNLGDKE